MRKTRFKIPLTLGILFFSIALGSNIFAQPSLVLNSPVKSEIIDGKTTFFTISLSANQTARIEANQTDADVSLTSYNPTGEKLLEWGLPLGRVGSEEILVIAETAGDYRIEVSPGNLHRNFGEFVIKLVEIRETTEDDKIKNKAALEISRIMPEAVRLAEIETVSARRTAIEIWNEVIRLAKLKNDITAETRALHTLARLVYDLGEIQKALDINLQLTQTWRELGNTRFELVATSRIGSIWYQLGEYEKAIAVFEKGIKISREINSKLNEADNISKIGDCYLASEQPEKALEYFEKALPLYIGLKIPILEASILSDLGRTYAAFGNHKKGIEFLNKALDLQKKESYLGDSVFSYLNLGKSYLESGEFDRAYDFLTQANSLANDLDNKTLLVQSLYHLALIEDKLGKLDKAIENLEAGLKFIEKIRGDLKSKSLRTSYFSTVQNFYELYADLLVKRAEKTNNAADFELAFELSERSRSRSLLDLLIEAGVDFKSTFDAKFLEKQTDLTEEINSKYQDREEILNRKSKKEQIDRINAEINDLEIEFERLNLEIRRENPRYSRLTGNETLSTRQIQNLLDKNTVLLEYKLGKKRSFLWLVTGSSIKFYELPNRREIEIPARRFYDLIRLNKKENANEIEELSANLNKILLAQVAPEIKGKRIAIVAEGILQYLPFSALRNSDKSYLTDNNETVILPSATVLAQLRQNKNAARRDEKTIAIFADPVFDSQDSRIAKNTKPLTNEQNAVFSKVLRDFKIGETLPRLLASREEARHISSFVDDKNAILRLGFDANLENIEVADLKNYRILHFATHGLLNTSRPELSGLVFSLYDENGKSQDGFLSLNDIYNLDLSSDMVVLSACQTALGKDVRGEGLIGVSRGFLYAGSQRIVASLWKVDDSATAEFMKLFYKNHLQEKLSASAALQQAKLELKKIPRYRSPFYWSAFILLGDW